MTAHGKKVDITTYTGGCGTNHVDVNPQLQIKEQSKVCVSIELVDAKGTKLATSGVVYENFVYTGPIDIIRWQAQIPRGGVEVHVYVEMDETLTTDTARCFT